jgi:hypothetical protein
VLYVAPQRFANRTLRFYRKEVLLVKSIEECYVLVSDPDHKGNIPPKEARIEIVLHLHPLNVFEPQNPHSPETRLADVPPEAD